MPPAASILKKRGKQLNKVVGLSKDLKKTVKNVGENAEYLSKKKVLDDAIELIEKKKITKTQFNLLIGGGAAAAAVTVIGVKLSQDQYKRAEESFNKRNGQEFKVNEISYDTNDDKDEISLSILNPDKIDISAKETILFISTTNNDVLKKKIDSKKILLNTLDYPISEVKPHGDDDNVIPNLIKVKIAGLDLTDSDKDMIMKGEGLFTIKLKADFNNDLEDTPLVPEFPELFPKLDLTYFFQIIQYIGITIASLVLLYLLYYVIRMIYYLTTKKSSTKYQIPNYYTL